MPAFFGEVSEGDEGVAAVVAGADQPKGFVPVFVEGNFVDDFGKSAACIFHHFGVGQAVCICLFFNLTHLGYGYEFHGCL